MLCFFVDVQNKIKTFIDPYLVSLRGFAPVDYFRVLSSVPCSYSGPLRMICSYSGPLRMICSIQWALTDDLLFLWAWAVCSYSPMPGTTWESWLNDTGYWVSSQKGPRSSMQSQIRCVFSCAVDIQRVRTLFCVWKTHRVSRSWSELWAWNRCAGQELPLDTGLEASAQVTILCSASWDWILSLNNIYVR